MKEKYRNFMTEVGPPSPTSERKEPKEPVLPRKLNKQEEVVDEKSKETFPPQSDIETKAVDAPRERRSSSPEEKEKYEHPEIASEATSSVKGEQQESKKPLSVHDKWVSPNFKETLEKKGMNLYDQIEKGRAREESIKQMYRRIQAGQPETAMQAEVRKLLKTQKLEPQTDGEGDVYFLRDEKGEVKYVIKTADGAALTINNDKNRASPFFLGDGVYKNKGVDPYESSVINPEIALKVAKWLGLEEVTPYLEVMILAGDFPDILDGTEEKKSSEAEELEKRMPTTRERVCSVQVFRKGCQDILSYLAGQVSLTPAKIVEMISENEEAFRELEATRPPSNFNQDHFEKIALLVILLGETDGNPDNYICEESPAGETRLVFKIDNGGTFPEDNKNIITGLTWMGRNYQMEFSPSMQEKIKGIKNTDFDEIAAFMRERGKSEASIKALYERIFYLRDWITQTAVIGLIDKSFEDLGIEQKKTEEV
jgi:hypothetical protein